MNDPMGGSETTKKRKADQVADVINRFLQNLVLKCGKDEGIRDYFHVGVIGYGNNDVVSPAFGGVLAGRDLVPIREIGENPSRIDERSKKIDDGAGGLVEQSVKFPTWFDPVTNGGTPMVKALGTAHSIISKWLSQNPSCFPPIVINVTDGESTDGDPTNAADAIRILASSDGNVLLFNIHISSQSVAPIHFPDSENGLPDDIARTLFRTSSTLTETMQTYAKQKGYATSPASKGFVFNADATSLIEFIDIGTRPSNLR